MTRDEILNMKAGREMDALVAEQVMGWTNCQKCEFATWLSSDKSIIASGEQWRGNPLPLDIAQEVSDKFNPRWETIKNYSTDIFAAWKVVEKSAGFMVENRQVYKPDEWECEIAFEGTYIYFASANTAPLAICRAALLAKLENEEAHEK